MDRVKLIEILGMVVVSAGLEGWGYISCGLEEGVDELVAIGLIELSSAHRQYAKLTETGWALYTGLEIGDE